MQGQGIISGLKDRMDEHSRTLFTNVPAICTQIDDQYRGVVSLKGDRNVVADDIPLLVPFAGDGYGIQYPFELPVEGVLHCSLYALDNVLSTTGNDVELGTQRHHSFQDAWFRPGVWMADQQLPDAEDGEYVFAHPSGATHRISDEGVQSFETPDTVSEQPLDEDGQPVDEPTSSIGVADDGTATLDGITRLGDGDAARVDRTAVQQDPENPRQYTEVDEPVAPIANPLDDGETEFDNPSSVSLDGPMDCGFYETRRHVPERREQDPDVSVTNPEDARYIAVPDAMRQAGLLPVGYQWLNVTEDTMKRIAADGTTIKPME